MDSYSYRCLMRMNNKSIPEVNFSSYFPSPSSCPSSPDIRHALKTDIHYELPGNYMRGAGDTYFSGTVLHWYTVLHYTELSRIELN